MPDLCDVMGLSPVSHPTHIYMTAHQPGSSPGLREARGCKIWKARLDRICLTKLSNRLLRLAELGCNCDAPWG